MSVRRIRAMDCDGNGCAEWAEVPAGKRADSHIPEGWMRVQARYHDGSMSPSMVLCESCGEPYVGELFRPAQADIFDADTDHGC